MTWVFGWPLELERAIEIAKARKLDRKHANMTENKLYLAAAFDIVQKLRLRKWPLLACWDGDQMTCVFALCVDKKARTAEQAKVRMSRMPPYETALRLSAVLQTEDGPKCYLYYDRTYTPWGGEVDSSDSSDESDSESCGEHQESDESDAKSNGEPQDAGSQAPVAVPANDLEPSPETKGE
ncbi:hypothetical protein CERSUDRAFT_75319 [Gelatoporia subvermispora B]|uniref:Uncharacterized protein n=1 Tax=Ceriporiopsis subvermispora (strain B) TaxID=914234 RepID=M2R995_CERS8|nr:hypothetical protein CERSUDRAFT_75319 [Gelatoporia subvermispora B]